MKQFLNYSSESLAGVVHGRSTRIAWPASIVLVLAAACSEAPPPTTSLPTGGSGGQVTAGTGGTGVTAGTSSTPTGGTPPAVSGAAGTVATGGSGGTGVGGGSGGSGTGGSSGGSGGSGGGSGGSGGSGGADGFVPLFNGTDLTGWTKGPTGGPLFAVDSTAGEPAIHVYPDATAQKDGTTQNQAWLRTDESFSSYVLHVEYKWGSRRFGDRAGKARDNGICFHLVPPYPASGADWPTSVEFQLGSQDWPGDWVSGNIFMLINKTRAQWPYTTTMGQQAWSATGTKKKIGAPDSYYKALSVPPNLNKGGGESVTTAATEWNIVELTVHGSKDAEYKVNGTVVNGLSDMEYDTGGGTFMPLDHGPIAIQAEFAEVYFRNIKIKVLP
jgi:hypothetical protein